MENKSITMSNTPIKEMSQEQLMDLMEHYSKGIIEAENILNDAVKAKLDIQEVIDDLMIERDKVEIAMYDVEDPRLLKKEIKEYSLKIKQEKKKLNPYKRIIIDTEKEIRRLRTIYDRAKSRYFNNKVM